MDICIAGLGARTPLGLQALSSAAAVRAGISRVAEHPYMVDQAGDPFMVAMDRSVDTHVRVDRMFALALPALTEVLAPLALAPTQVVHLYLGLPSESPHFSKEAAALLCRRLVVAQAERCQLRVVPCCEGGAAGIVALEQAVGAMRRDLFEFCVVGAVDSFLDAALLEELDAAGRVCSLANRWGFMPGEGAGMLLVCRASLPRANRWPVLGWIASLATGHEPASMHSEGICTGTVLASVMDSAATQAGTTVTRQYCDINGERYREHEFSFASARARLATFEDATAYVTASDCWGHVGAATAPLLAILPLLHKQRGVRVGAWPMIWCGSETGRRAAMVLHLGKEAT